jgi:hypothetical protein
VKTCKPLYPKPVFCEDMMAALNTETQTGLAIETYYRFSDPGSPQPIRDLVAVRNRSNQKPKFLFWCPWCLGALYPGAKEATVK